MTQYKLCRIELSGTTKVVPITTKGIQYGEPIDIREDEPDNYYYSIYESRDNGESWDEYMYYGDDFDKAVNEYEKLKGDN